VSTPRASAPAYIALLVFALLAGYVVKQRTDGIFACSPDGYRAGRYLGYCNGASYGDYDHGAVWFGLQPDVREKAAAAQVLFLGSSRMQFAFSTIVIDKWFEAHEASHYLLGFSHTENASFAAPLLAKLQPRARAYVINVDRFFSDEETGPGSEILHKPDILAHYRAKHRWQQLHRAICGRLPSLCGTEFAYYRNAATGHWVVRGGSWSNAAPVAEAPPSGEDRWPHYVDVARGFIDALPVPRDCVILTVVPYPATKLAEARAIAAGVGMPLVTVEVDDLWTFDGSHLDKPSTERWSRAFLQVAGPTLERCVHPAGSETAP
jgi:hypothetical protein